MANVGMSVAVTHSVQPVSGLHMVSRRAVYLVSGLSPASAVQHGGVDAFDVVAEYLVPGVSLAPVVSHDVVDASGVVVEHTHFASASFPSSFCFVQPTSLIWPPYQVFWLVSHCWMNL